MKVTRREFLKYCSISAAALGLSALDIFNLEKVFANPSAPSVIWLQGSACCGCSVSLLNRISDKVPRTVTELLTDSINLIYHQTIMSYAGEHSVAAAKQAYASGNFILVVEGAIPTAFDGAGCWAWTYDGKNATFKDVVQQYAEKAAHTICIGTCASFGGIPAAGTNPTLAKSVSDFLGKDLIKISGCPAHPDWFIGTVVNLLLGNPVPLDIYGRPTEFYGQKIHKSGNCYRYKQFQNDQLATQLGQDENLCLFDLGCRGPATYANCYQKIWNGGVNWCIGANSPCLGCVNPDFPGDSFYLKKK